MEFEIVQLILGFGLVTIVNIVISLFISPSQKKFDTLQNNLFAYIDKKLEQQRAENKAENERTRAENKADNERTQSDNKADNEKLRAEFKDGIENLRAENKAENERTRAENKEATEKAQAENKAENERTRAENKADSEQTRAENKEMRMDIRELGKKLDNFILRMFSFVPNHRNRDSENKEANADYAHSVAENSPEYSAEKSEGDSDTAE